jgi:hypothetical protein
VPPKALVWEDDQGKVWLSYNSSDYLYNTIYPAARCGSSSGDRALRKTHGRDERSGDEIGKFGRSRPEGGKLASHPVQHPTTFDLKISLKAVKALGLEVPTCCSLALTDDQAMSLFAAVHESGIGPSRLCLRNHVCNAPKTDKPEPT